MSTVVVRAAVPGDCEAVAAMVVALAALHDVASGTTAQGLREAAFGVRPTIEILVATIDGQLVGYLIHQDTYSTWRGVNGLFVVDLYVDPVWRGRRIGEALMSAAARRGLEKDARFMRLDIDATTRRARGSTSGSASRSGRMTATARPRRRRCGRWRGFEPR